MNLSQITNLSSFADSSALIAALNSTTAYSGGKKLVDGRGRVQIKDLMEAAQRALADTANGGDLTIAPSPLRTFQEALMVVLRAVNEQPAIIHG